MAKARTKKTKAKKKITKKVTKKKVSKKATPKKKTVARKANPPTKKPRPMSDKMVIRSIWVAVEELQARVETITNLLLGKPAGQTQTTTAAPDQASLFDTPTNTGDEPLTFDVVNQALQELMVIAGQDEVRGILKTFKVVRVKDLKEKDYDAVIQACDDAKTDMPDATDTTKETAATSMF